MCESLIRDRLLKGMLDQTTSNRLVNIRPISDNVDIYLQIMKSSVQSTTQWAALLLFFIVKYVAGVTIVINVKRVRVQFIIEIKLVG